MAICPKCGSDKFHYQLRSAGTRSKSNRYRTGVDDSWLIPASQKTYKSERKQKAVGFCPNCGYIEEKKEEEKMGCLGCFLCIIFYPITLCVLLYELCVWFYKTDKISLDRKWRLLIIAVFLIILFAIISPFFTE